MTPGQLWARPSYSVSGPRRVPRRDIVPRRKGQGKLGESGSTAPWLQGSNKQQLAVASKQSKASKQLEDP